MFAGFVVLGESYQGIFLVKNGQETPMLTPQGPVFKVYGPGCLMQGGIGIASKFDSDPGLYEYALAVDPSNGYEVGPATVCS